MTCPTCRTTMRLQPGINPEYICGGCGTRRPASKTSAPAAPHIEAFVPPEETPKAAPPSPQKSAPPEEPLINDKEFERPKPKEKVTGSKRKGRQRQTLPSEDTAPHEPAAAPPKPSPAPTPPAASARPDRTKELTRLADIRRTIANAILRLRKTENELKEKVRESTSELEALQLTIDELEEWIKR